jgi:glycosyltransferase involved in cell wall biosynthesis
MIVGLLTPYYPDEQTISSGIANHFFTLANALIDEGHYVVVIHIRPSYGENDPIRKKQHHPQITQLTFPVRLSKKTNKFLGHKWAVRSFLLQLKCMLITFKRLDKIIKEYKIDVIETTNYYSLCYLNLFLKKPKIPVSIRVSTTFLQIADEFYPFKSRLLNKLGKIEIAMIRKSRYLITHAQHHALEMERTYSIKADRFTVIPHGLPLPLLPSHQPNNSNTTTILFVGRFEYRKGIDLLLNAIPIVLKQYTNIIFKLIGSDNELFYEKSFQVQHQTDIIEKVIFYGSLNQTETRAAYATCDIFVAPSRYESFGLIYIEAMSYGKPVIGFRVGGVTDVIEDGYNGLFADTGDVVSLANKLMVLIANVHARKTMGLNARKTVEAKFTAKQLAISSAIYYQEIINSYN